MDSTFKTISFKRLCFWSTVFKPELWAETNVITKIQIYVAYLPIIQIMFEQKQKKSTKKEEA